MINHFLRGTAYEFALTAVPWMQKFHTIQFTGQWRTELLELYAQRYPRRDHPNTVPIVELNDLFRAAAPNVVAARGAGTDSGIPWLYAADPLPEDVMIALVNVWVTDLLTRGKGGRELDRDAVDELVDAIADSLPEWTPEPVDLSAMTLSKGGTAIPDRRLYQLLSEFIAARLAGTVLSFREESLRFRVVGTRDGTELVSWPPRMYRRKGRDWHFSLRVRVSLHTVPFSERVRLHVTTGVRRWMTGSPISLGWGDGATCYLEASLPWLIQDGMTPRLIANGVRHDPREDRVVWGRSSLLNLLPTIDTKVTVPRADELLREPDRWTRKRDGITALVVHSTGLGTHEVGTGISPGERRIIDNWVEEALAPELTRMPDLVRATRRAKPVLWPRVPSTDESKRAAADRAEAADRRKALAAALDGRPLEIDVRFEREPVKEALIKALTKLLDLGDPSEDGETLRWTEKQLDVVVHATSWGELSAGLDIPKLKGKALREKTAAEIHRRRTVIRTHFGTPAEDAPIRLALVELADLRGNKRDPKFAIRLGCADSRRVSQFIRPELDVLDNRARSAILDGFRQLGAVTAQPYKLDEGLSLPPDLQYIGMWVVRQTSARKTRGPAHRLVTVRIRRDEQRYRLEGWDDDLQDWISYPELLIRLTRSADVPAGDKHGRVWRPLSQLRGQTESAIKAVLWAERNRPTLLLVDAGNMRRSWPWLGNGHVVKDMIGFSNESPQRLRLYGEHLRLVQVRDGCGRDEVPQAYAPVDDGGAGFASGIWHPQDAGPDNRVFASITDVPPQAGSVPRNMVKMFDTADYPPAPGKSGWTPGYREITVIGCRSAAALGAAGIEDEPIDEPVVWAALTHQLRHVDDYEPLGRPVPLHLARRAEEYVLSVDPPASAESDTVPDSSGTDEQEDDLSDL